MKKTIICGFAGIGKTTLAQNKLGFIDLESTPFEKDWYRYVKVATHIADNGYCVMTSCHVELRKTFRDKSIEYVLAIPSKERKEEYIQRYINRGNSTVFINNFKDNFELFLTILPHEKNVLIVDNYLSTALNLTLSKETEYEKIRV